MRMHTWLTIRAKERPTLIRAKLTEAKGQFSCPFGSTKLTHFAPTKQNSDPANDYDCPLIISARRLHTAHMVDCTSVRATGGKAKLTKAKGQTLRLFTDLPEFFLTGRNLLPYLSLQSMSKSQKVH